MNLKLLARWALGLALLAVVFVLGDVREITRLRVLWGFVAGMFLATLCFVLLHTLRWKRIVDALSKKEVGNYLTFYQWMLHSYALGYIMPKDVSLLTVRTYYLRQHHHLPLSASLFSVTLDRLLDLLVFGTVIVPSFLFAAKLLSATQAVVLTAVLIAGLLAAARWKGKETFGLMIRCYEWILKIPVLRRRMPGVQDTSGWAEALGERGFYSLVAWTLGAFLFLVFRFFFTAMALEVPLLFLQALFLVPIIQISGLINITPAALGVLELGSWAALLLVGLPRDEILRFVLGQRVLLTVVLLSLFLLHQLLILGKGRGGRTGGAASSRSADSNRRGGGLDKGEPPVVVSDRGRIPPSAVRRGSGTHG